MILVASVKDLVYGKPGLPGFPIREEVARLITLGGLSLVRLESIFGSSCLIGRTANALDLSPSRISFAKSPFLVNGHGTGLTSLCA